MFLTPLVDIFSCFNHKLYGSLLKKLIATFLSHFFCLRIELYKVAVVCYKVSQSHNSDFITPTARKKVRSETKSRKLLFLFFSFLFCDGNTLPKTQL